MRHHPAWLLALCLGATLSLTHAQDKDKDKDPKKDAEAAKVLEEQRKALKANWELVNAGELATVETDHLLVAAAKENAGKLKDLGELLEKHYAQAVETLKFEENKPAHPGKVAVYLFPEKDNYAAFVRRVMKKRYESGDTAGNLPEDESLLAAVAPSANPNDAPPDLRAAEQVAALLLRRKAGVATELPPWLAEGFGRATVYRILPKDKLTEGDRKKAAAAAQLKKRSAKDVWGGAALDADEAMPLYASMADFLAYSAGAPRFPQLVEGFKPMENQPKRTTEQALETAGIKADNVDRGWKVWVLNPK